MEYFEVIAKRHSVRSYRPDPVEPEKLEQVMEAARLAPTAVNFQAFKIYVTPTKGREAELQKIYNKDWFVEAPYVIGVCAIPGQAWVRRDQKNYSDVDAAIVMDHIVLAATALGLGSCWVGAFDAAAAKTILGLDETLEPVAFTPLGYPRETGFKKVRKPLEELVVYQ